MRGEIRIPTITNRRAARDLVHHVVVQVRVVGVGLMLGLLATALLTLLLPHGVVIVVVVVVGGRFVAQAIGRLPGVREYLLLAVALLLHMP
jgi:hypothetical protein